MRSDHMADGWYVVTWREHLRDGQESGGKVVHGLDRAVEVANRVINGFGGCNTTVEVFELGKPVPLWEDVVEEPQAPITKRRLSAE